MTIKEARERLKPPLVFGKAEQIAAVRFIEEYERAKAALENCPHGDCDVCDGEGTEECRVCAGSGRVECSECMGKESNCDCLKEFSEEVKACLD
jgi:hypothetical protein